MQHRDHTARKHIHTWAPWRYSTLSVYRRCTVCEHVQCADRDVWTPAARDLPAGVRHLADVPWQDVGARERQSALVNANVWSSIASPRT
jgi:hypothetical protein